MMMSLKLRLYVQVVKFIIVFFLHYVGGNRSWKVSFPGSSESHSTPVLVHFLGFGPGVSFLARFRNCLFFRRFIRLCFRLLLRILLVSTTSQKIRIVLNALLLLQLFDFFIQFFLTLFLLFLNCLLLKALVFQLIDFVLLFD